jgi:hypothetical protein
VELLPSAAEPVDDEVRVYNLLHRAGRVASKVVSARQAGPKCECAVSLAKGLTSTTGVPVQAPSHHDLRLWHLQPGCINDRSVAPCAVPLDQHSWQIKSAGYLKERRA